MIFTKKVIYGCESYDDTKEPYLTRYYLLRTRWFELCLHIMRRSDTPGLFHDHPWDFWTLVLWQGYDEVLPHGVRRVRPLQFLYRPADWLHHVRLIDGKKAVTLTLMGKRKREWNFFDPNRFGYMWWVDYIRKFCQ